MASKLFLDYFYLHAVSNCVSSHLLPTLDEESVCGILKEATLRAIHDIEIEFTLLFTRRNMTQVKCRSILELAFHIFFICAYFAIARYGVIAEPKVLDWRAIKGNDVFLVVESDGMFESLSMKSVCGLLEENSPKCSSSSSLADCIIKVALRRGRTDNLLAIVVPLRPADLTP
ncbi:hypothetical protein RJ639_028478 [Escallonia herrerae]|uniref:PPM-type phosphatase domain-containing protein n=1 Tax=Escallonia herrerae TaxID=1293975 RepID=A0AA89BHH2_9ASTE|nr:hypothetical protein RJ639_028478 [Escallonia herrerae]